LHIALCRDITAL